MRLVKASVEQPISVIVTVLFTFLAGLVAIRYVPVEMTPEVEDTIVAVTTFWENASPQEIESEVIDPQEEKLQSLSGLRSITSVSSQSQGLIRLEFNAGIDKNIALRDVSDKLREVQAYPFGVDEPVIEATDPDSQDYIAWYILSCEDSSFDVRQLQSFAEDQLKPMLERVPGVSEVNAIGGVEREVQIEVDVEKLADYGLTMSMLAQKLRDSNQNASAGALTLGTKDIRLRSVGRFSSAEQVMKLVLKNDASTGMVYVGDVATVKESFKEAQTFVRASGQRSIAFNFQREPGSNVLEIMGNLKAKIKTFNEPGQVLDLEAQRLGLKGKLNMKLSYDATRYVQKALIQVENNIYIGGALAIVVLLMFLRSLRSLGIIAISIPVSMVGAIVIMVMMGRTVNVISLAGIAFAVGMVVDNSIVVLENIYRHLEMGKNRIDAAIDGCSEVAGAVLASSLTTLIVFIPILLITDQVGQLFRDISLAIMTSVAFSYLVAVTVIPAAASRILNEKRYRKNESEKPQEQTIKDEGLQDEGLQDEGLQTEPMDDQPMNGFYQKLMLFILRQPILNISIILVMALGSIYGAYRLMPPMDYLPKGNRNITFGLMLTPPGLSLNELEDMGSNVENEIRPYWEDQPNRPPIQEAFTGRTVYPTALSEYFLVSTGGVMFHGGIASDDRHAVDNVALLQHATRPDVLPGVFAFAFQFPLFRLGGSTGSAVKINLIGRDLDLVSMSAGALMGHLMQNYGPQSTRPDPSNFNLKVQELQLKIDEEAMVRAGLNRRDIIMAMQAAGDGLFLGEYEFQGELVDLKLWSHESQKMGAITKLESIPIATPLGQTVYLGQMAEILWTDAAEKIKRVGRRRAVTLEFTAPLGMPLEQVVGDLNSAISELRQNGAIASAVQTQIEGSAGKLNDIRNALLGDGTWTGLVSSSMFTSFVAIYLLMCILFQSWLKPLVIMFTVPLATFGGFLGLFIVYSWSLSDPYMPIQNLDVLTLLGFIILSGVVVNNAILIVAQTDVLTKRGLGLQRAIVEAAHSRIRPIFMSLLTSVGGMLPLVLNPGSGSELYRGLGAVVVGGMLLSTLFTLVLIPLLLNGFHFGSKVGPKTPLLAMLGFLSFFSLQNSNAMASETSLAQELPERFKGQKVEPSSGLYIDSDLETPLEPSTEPSAHLDWWKLLNDRDLEKLMEICFAHELDLQILEKRTRKVMHLRDQARSESWPKISGDASALREKMPSFQFPSRTALEVGLNGKWTLDYLGRLKNLRKMAHLDVSMAQLEILAYAHELRSQIISSYFRYRYLLQSIEHSMQQVQLLKTQLQREKILHDHGRKPAGAQRSWQRKLLQAKEGLSRLKGERELEYLRMKTWIGEQQHLAPLPHDANFRFESIPELSVGTPENLLQSKVEVVIAGLRVQKAASALSIVKKEWFPKLSFGTRLSFFGSQWDQWFGSDRMGYSFGPQLSWRLFEFGKIKQEKNAATEDYDAAVLGWRSRLRTAVKEVQSQIEGLQTSRERLSIKRHDLSYAHQDLVEKQAQQKIGRISLGDICLGQLDKLSAQQLHLDALHAKSQAQVMLYRALGAR
jgi:HAE1 family hydrophobic/amphiphilic exporter-1